MNTQVRDLLRDAMGKQAFDNLSPEERKRITSVMNELVAKTGINEVRAAVSANKGKINPGNVNSAPSRQSGGLELSGAATVLLPLMAALKSFDQDKQKSDILIREPGHAEPDSLMAEGESHKFPTPFPDPMAPPAPPRPR